MNQGAEAFKNTETCEKKVPASNLGLSIISARNVYRPAVSQKLSYL